MKPPSLKYLDPELYRADIFLDSKYLGRRSISHTLHTHSSQTPTPSLAMYSRSQRI